MAATGNRNSSVGIATGYGVADQLRLITKDPEREIFLNHGAMYEAVKTFITEILFITINVIAV
jgi:hypothetical protein